MTPAEELRACYREAEDIADALQKALDADDDDQLASLIERRAGLLDRAAAILAAVSSGAIDAEPDRRAWDEALAAGRRAMRAGERLHALVASRAHEIPAKLAELRGGRTALRGYGESHTPPESVDRLG